MRTVGEQDEQKYEARQKRLSWKMQGAWQFGSPKSDIKTLENESWAFFSIGRDLVTQ